MDVNARLVVYAPDGEKQGVLRFPASWDASMPWNDTPALRFTYGTATPDGDLLNGACEVALEVATLDGGWVEPVNARYCVMESAVDSALGQAGQVRYTAPGYASLLGGVCVVPSQYGVASAYTEDGKRKFNSALPGEIISTVLAEARQTVNGLLPGLELGFTKQQDSSGAPWARKISLDYEPGISLLTILENLAAQGQCDWWMQGRTLHVVNPDSTATHTRVVVDRPVSERPIRSSLAGLLHTAFLVGEKGKTWRVDNTDTIRPWGASVKVITQGGVNEEATARRLVDAKLQAGKRERTEYTAKVPLDVAGIIPLTDFRVGDWIQAPGRGGRLEPMRVHQCTINFTDGTLAATLTLNDRFVDAQVRAAKRTKGIVNGASGDAGTGSTPTRAEKAEPAQPVGIVAESEGYWEDTVARSKVRVGFAPVVLDVNGLGIQVDHYEVNVAGVVVNTDKTSNIVVDGLAPDKTVTVQVVAVSTDGVRSKPGMVNVVTKRPDEKLAPPTRFTVEADFGIVDLVWDGKLQFKGGDPYAPPKHFKHIRIEESIDQRNWVTVGTAVAGGLTLDRQDKLGTTLYYRAKSVTTNGIESDDYGPVSEVVVRSRVSDELEKAKRENAAAVEQWKQDTQRLERELAVFRIPADRVDGLDQLVQRSASGKNTVTYSPTAPMGDGKTAGDIWWTYDAYGAIVGQWVWLNSKWVKAELSHKVIASVDVGKLTAGKASMDEAVVRKLFAEVVTAKINQAGKFIGGDAILDGTVDASKVRAPEAWFKKIFAEDIMAGKVTSRMFSTDAAFEGPGVRIDRTGWRVTPSSGKGGIYANGEYGLFANDPNGKTTFHIKPNGEATFSENITSRATIKGVNLEGVTVSMKDGRQNGAVLTPSEIRYMEGGRNIGALSWRVLVAPPQGVMESGQTSTPNGGWHALSFGYGGRQWAKYGMTTTSSGLVAPVTGQYFVSGNAGVRGHGDSLVGVAVSTPNWGSGISVQTSQMAIGNGVENTMTAAGVLEVRAGETIQLMVHNGGGASAVVGKAALFAKCISN